MICKYVSIIHVSKMYKHDKHSGIKYTFFKNKNYFFKTIKM